MGLKPRSEEPGYVSTITAEELNAYNAEYADGYPSDEEEEEEMEGGKSDKPSMAVKFTTAVKNFSLPSPEDIKGNISKRKI